MDYNSLSLKMHEENKGKVEVISKVKIKDRDDLSTAYTPGVAEPCRKIRDNKADVYKYTCKGNMVAVVSDGTAVLGLGDIGPEAAIPVMEGKAILFKEFGGVDAFPICLDTKDVDEIVETVKRIAPVFGGINLEDISAPRCFEIERRLKEELDIPVFHDDQHGTAIVVSAGLINALRLVGKDFDKANVVINGAGSAGISICKLLLQLGIGNVVLVDKQGALCPGQDWMNPAQADMAEITNKDRQTGNLAEIMKGKDVFIGVSAPNIVTAEMVASMAADPIVLARANPTPEIMPEEAKKGGVRLMATGRTDYP
uniref:NAD(P)-dependent malic enzyme n=1 Tax=Coprococcus sp. TaxID=2049024 RepID=UPI004024D3F9